MSKPTVKVMSIAGSDSGAGAGIQADIKTIAALGGYATTVITAVTAQNTRRVVSAWELPVSMIKDQIDAVITDIGTDAVKTGMLSSSAVIEAVAEKLREHKVGKVVVDPVMVSKGGDRLLQKEALQALKEKLFPLATLVTPNAEEAGVIVGRQLASLDDIRAAAEEIVGMGAGACVVTGGIYPGPATDLLYDGKDIKAFSAVRIASNNTHGTGCTFASAATVYLARGDSVRESVAQAKKYVAAAIRASFPLGTGYGPLSHFHEWWGGTEKAEPQ
ncbi:MAG: bifunctional hydroxymethylpyrimidine kinase/phosphomethylpyrimidine kinase [SAR202 cluster bacterium]|nr:bifunctional hydroxymethylpyrimidine kinase/phosphomethylpyrimidine kinase [SAR202 cluster bacterium]